MKWSLRIFSFWGIDVYVHVTFFVLLGYLLLFYDRAGGIAVAAFRMLVVLSLFFCVLLHEFGHALAARRCGIATRDITILPIGGVARLECVSRRPLHEFAIALAGPSVNLVIAFVLVVCLIAAPGVDPLKSVEATWNPPDGKLFSVIGWQPFLGALLVLNASVTLLNLVPAFPMDGGRILRSLLASWLRFDIATYVTSCCGQLLAVVFILIDLTTAAVPVLSVIAVLIFLGTFAESNAARLFVALEGLNALDGAEPEMMALTTDTTLGVAQGVLSGTQPVYPVFDGQRLLGFLLAEDIHSARRERGDLALVADVPIYAIERVAPETSLGSLFDRMLRRRLAAVAVTDGEQFLAIVTPRSVQARAYIKRERRAAGVNGAEPIE